MSLGKQFLRRVALAAMVLGGASPALAAKASRAPFGALADGTQVESVTLSNAKGVSARIMTLGATLQSLIVPDTLRPWRRRRAGI